MELSFFDADCRHDFLIGFSADDQRRRGGSFNRSRSPLPASKTANVVVLFNETASGSFGSLPAESFTLLAPAQQCTERAIDQSRVQICHVQV